MTSAAHAVPAQSALVKGISTVQRDLSIGGTKRSYLAVRASTKRTGLPLLVVLHGRGITARQESTRTGFLDYAQRGLADVVYPVGIGESWNAGHGCCGLAVKVGAHDTAFVTAVVGDATRYFGSDPRRVYLVGYSNGGRLAFTEVCEQPGLFAAVATYGAVPPASCPARKPISALIASGTNDPIVRQARSAPSSTAAVDSVVSQWRTQSHCTASATGHTGPLTTTTWTGCDAGTEVVGGIYQGLTHYWPVAAKTLAPYTTPVGDQAAAANVMWNFLSGHTLT
ncbi:alpha/beta hydrolase family esterase [Amycolatopsis sp.]|uniref:alpha/beta hydrolase family esterase n=1 Tax=Amycolatopsis sp. TaxID=37632 RepID=UPI002C3E2F65|nr:PHB depolymerase family esterase [Amycolatopsis sp.]HVV14107.1 PHB depolymerase family esterase [Amycolatopsis sp.]